MRRKPHFFFFDTVFIFYQDTEIGFDFQRASGNVDSVSPLILQRKANQMASNTAVVITSTTQDNAVVLTPAIQKQVKVLREARNVAKQAKELGDTARTAVLDFVGETEVNLVGTDAKGKRLISVKVIPSTESFDWERLMRDQPELYTMLKSEYVIPKGQGTPTLRVDLI